MSRKLSGTHATHTAMSQNSGTLVNHRHMVNYKDSRMTSLCHAKSLRGETSLDGSGTKEPEVALKCLE